MSKIVYDPVLKRPGCVLLQAVYGANSQVAYLFDTKDWLLSPTPDLKLFEVSDDQLKKLVYMTEQARSDR